MVSVVRPVGGGELGDLHILALAVLRQTVDDIRFRPYPEQKFRCCPYPPDQCAQRFLDGNHGELWSHVAGLSPDAIQRRLDRDR
jgi:hypothetical protein